LCRVSADASSQELGICDALDSLLSDEEILSSSYTVIAVKPSSLSNLPPSVFVQRTPPVATMSREEKLQRIVHECNKVAVVKFMAQSCFKETSVAEWARSSGVEVASSSKRVIAESISFRIII
jgi:hypothetical protein